MNKNDMKLEFENNSSKNYIVAYLENRDNIVDYEIEMINNNPTSGALSIEIIQFNDKVKVLYDTTGKISIKEYLKNRVIRKSEFIIIVKNMISCFLECKNYFLDEKKYCMDLDTIYVSEKDLSVYLLYFPVKINSDSEEDINILFKDIVKNLIIDFVNVEEKDSEGVIQKVLKYLRRDEFKISEFKEYLEKFGEQDIKVISNYGNVRQQRTNLTEDKNENINNNSANEKKDIKQSPSKNVKESKVNKYINILLMQLFTFGIIALTLIFKISEITEIIIIAVSIAIDATVVIAISINNSPENESIVVKRKAKTGIISKETEKKLQQNKPSKREIVTEMSFATEMLDAKTAFLISKKAGTIEKIFINKDIFRIGRFSEDVDCVLDNKAVSKVHAEIKKDSDKYYLMDLGSKNGTSINGRRLNKNEFYEVKNGDNIAFANSDFEFSIS